MKQQTEREKFEAWTSTYSTLGPEHDGHGQYVSIERKWMWHAWQARAALDVQAQVAPKAEIPLRISDTGKVSVDARDVVRSAAFQRSVQAVKRIREGKAAPAAPVREPLSDELARDLIWRRNAAWIRSDRVNEDDALELIRAVEQHHGITAPSGKEKDK